MEVPLYIIHFCYHTFSLLHFTTNNGWDTMPLTGVDAAISRSSYKHAEEMAKN